MNEQNEIKNQKDKFKHVKGTVKETVGKVTGDKRTEFEGKGEKIAGRVREGWDQAKEAIQERIDDVGDQRRKVS